MSSQTVTKTIVTKPKKNKQQKSKPSPAPQTVERTTVIRNKKNKSRQQSIRNRSRNQFNNSLAKNCYSDLLNDPFNNPPCRIGYGTMVPTQLGTVVYRTTTAANADGSFGLYVIPTLGTTSNPIGYNNAGAAVATWTTAGWQNIAQYPTTLLSECRIIALGVKITPLIAATAAPATVLAGSISGVARTTLDGLTPTAVLAYSMLQPFVVRADTLMVNSRPIDNQAYEFLTVNAVGSTSNIWPNSTPVIAITGAPASANFLIEAIMHFEYIPIPNTTNTREYEANASYSEEPKISHSFPSQEKLWDYTFGRLNPSAVFDLAASFTNLATARTVQNMLHGNYGGQRLGLQQ